MAGTLMKTLHSDSLISCLLLTWIFILKWRTWTGPCPLKIKTYILIKSKTLATVCCYFFLPKIVFKNVMAVLRESGCEERCWGPGFHLYRPVISHREKLTVSHAWFTLLIFLCPCLLSFSTLRALPLPLWKRPSLCLTLGWSGHLNRRPSGLIAWKASDIHALAASALKRLTVMWTS